MVGIRVQRIAAMLVLWWYFYISKKAKVVILHGKIESDRGNAEFPKSKDLLKALMSGLKPVSRTSERTPTGHYPTCGASHQGFADAREKHCGHRRGR